MRLGTRWLAGWIAGLGLLIAAVPAWAQGDDLGRAGRVAALAGRVELVDRDTGRWEPAFLNRAVAAGDRIVTGAESRVVLRIGSTTLRLGADTELQLLRLDEDALQVALSGGHLALRVRSPEVAGEVVVRTTEARFRPLQTGFYRFDREGEITRAGVWEGELALDDVVTLRMRPGEQVEFWRDRGFGGPAYRSVAMRSDGFAWWAVSEDSQEDVLQAREYVSPEMTGAEELDRYGRWETHPEFGVIWIPLAAPPGWAPFQQGRWAWVSPWGWTWVDEQPWAFAPSHYGRWLQWQGQWAWTPGAYVARPAFAPALVLWAGGPSAGVSIGIGVRTLPGARWSPLPPWERWTPWFPAAPRYVERVQAPWPRDRRILPPPRPAPVPRVEREPRVMPPPPMPGPSRDVHVPGRPDPLFRPPAGDVPPRPRDERPAPPQGREPDRPPQEHRPRDEPRREPVMPAPGPWTDQAPSAQPTSPARGTSRDPNRREPPAPGPWTEPPPAAQPGSPSRGAPRDEVRREPVMPSAGRSADRPAAPVPSGSPRGVIEPTRPIPSPAPSPPPSVAPRPVQPPGAAPTAPRKPRDPDADDKRKQAPEPKPPSRERRAVE